MHKNWKTYKLSEVIQIIGGGTPKTSIPEFWNGSIPWLSVKDFQGEQKFVFQTEKTITEEGLKKSSTKILPKGAIIISARGTVGELAVLEKEMTFNQSCYGILPNDKTDNNYLYYLLKQKIRELQGLSYGSVFDTITTKTFDSLDVYLPPLSEQTQIANILSAIDDKIENNLAINKTLEDMAMALYKHWFVDFGPFQEGEFMDSELGLIPKGWEVKRLEEVVQVNSNSIKKDKEPKIINYIDIASVKEGWVEEIKTIKYEDAPSRARRIISDGDIIWSTVRPNRKSRFLALGFSENTIVSTGFVVMSPILISYSYLYLCSCTKDFVDYLVSRATGSSYPAVTGKVFEEYEILIPEKAILDRFSIIVEPMFLHSSSNDIENQTLTNLRDTLLPKLISGEVRLKEFREGIDAEINSA
jgi:type I restriction enzyme S subunit